MMHMSPHEKYLENRNLQKQALAIWNKSRISNSISYAYTRSAHPGSSRCCGGDEQHLVKWLVKLSLKASSPRAPKEQQQ